MSLFRLDASIVPSNSAGAELADLAERQWQAAHVGESVVRRNVGTDPLPADAWGLAVTASFTPEDDRSAAQKDAVALAADLAAELQSADAAIFAVPLYNFGVSQHFKAWVDLVIAGAGPTNPILANKPAVLIATIGGGYGPGTPREGWDHSTGYLQRIIGDVWQADLTVVTRELTLAEANPAMESLRGLAGELHAKARDAAQNAGKSLSA